MTTGASKEVLAKFAQGEFWDGLRMFLREREANAGRLALSAMSWEDVVKLKGKVEECTLLARLEKDVQEFVASQGSGKK